MRFQKFSVTAALTSSLLMLVVSTAAAESAPRTEAKIKSRSDSITEVILFGGFRASQAQMDCWEKGAEKDSRFGKDFRFRGIPYPTGASASAQGAVSGARSAIRDIVARINNNPKKKFVIAGHSSGAAISNEVARLVKNPHQIELVDLDGFAPSSSLQSKVKATCWYAKNPKRHLLSRNGGSMKSNCQSSKSYVSSTCQSAWCLHFSLVNKSVPPTLASADFSRRGYQGCSSNLDWLELPAKSKTAAHATAAVVH